MYFIPVYDMPSCYDIMHASYYGASIDDYAIIENFSMHAIY